MSRPSSRASGRPHILQVITHLDLGGAEEVAIALTEQLYGQPERAYDISFFAVNGVQDTPVGQAMKRRLDRIGVPVHSGSRLELKRGGFVQAAARLAALTWRLRPDVLHLHTEIPELTQALSRGFLARVPAQGRSPLLTRTLHNTYFWGPWQRMGVQVERYLAAVPMAACSAGALEAMQTFRSEHGLKPLASGQARVIYNGVAPATTHRQPATDRPRRVMFAGRLEPQKGADLLPAILAQAGQLGHPPAELTLYGAGSLGPELERWAAQGVSGWKIDIQPPTPNLRDRMAQHDLLLMPSRFEGLGLVAAEALMAGLPVIGTRIAGLSEIFPADYPLLAPPEDTQALGTLLAQGLGDNDRFLELAQGLAAPTEDKFGLSRMAREYDELYQDLLLGRAAAGAPQRSGAI